MKKHRSFQNIEKKEEKSRAGMYLAIFIAVVMIGGVGGIFLGNPGSEPAYSFGKYSFWGDNNRWVTEINNEDVSFYFLPQYVYYFNVSAEAIKRIKNSEGIIITFDPEINSTIKLQVVDLFKFEVSKTIVDVDSTKKIGFGAVKKTNISNFPVITCNNASFIYPVIVIDYSDTTEIKLEKDCIVVSAVSEQAMVGIMDNLRYRLYGVINEEE